MTKQATTVGRTWTAADARAVLREWAQSGKSGAAFARSIGVVPQRLFWWRERLGREAGADRVATLLPVTVRPTSLGASSAALVVTTPDGVRIEVGEVGAATAAWVRAVLGGERRP